LVHSNYRNVGYQKFKGNPSFVVELNLRHTSVNWRKILPDSPTRKNKQWFSEDSLSLKELKMGVGFNRREPTYPSKVYRNPKVVENFQDNNWLVYFDRLRGYDNEISLELAMNFQNVRGKNISVLL
jgi:hypothetical protein